MPDLRDQNIKDAAKNADRYALDVKLAFLQSAAAYSQSGSAPECIETHMSWLFLREQEVCKLKKPVRFPYLDFTTLAARELYCREEIRLNARLAPGVYLGLLVLQWSAGRFVLLPEAHMQDAAETLDWLVLMRRLPACRMLHQMIQAGGMLPQDVDALLELLQGFYRNAAVVRLDPDDYLARFQRSLSATREVLLRPQFQLRDAAYLIDRLATALAQAQPLLRQRVLGRHILEGHGDLRPEHICLLPSPVVIDCIEFNAQLRQVDPFDELAYLNLECEMAGAPWIGRRLLQGYAVAMGDAVHPALLQLYAAHRALMRARFAMAHLLDPQPCTPEKWMPMAQRYLQHAMGQLDRFDASSHRV